MIKELNHIGLLTADMAASRNFYETILSGTPIRDHKDAEGFINLLGLPMTVRALRDIELKEKGEQ